MSSRQYNSGLLRTVCRLLLAAVLIVGGLQGLWVLLPAVPHSLAGIPLLFFLFYGSNVVAGLQLWRRPQFGLAVTVVLQLFQIVRIQGPTFSYLLANGVGIWVMQSPQGLTTETNLASCFRYSVVTGFGPSMPTGATYFGVNIFAVVVASVAVVLWSFHRRDRDHIPTTAAG